MEQMLTSDVIIFIIKGFSLELESSKEVPRGVGFAQKEWSGWSLAPLTLAQSRAAALSLRPTQSIPSSGAGQRPARGQFWPGDCTFLTPKLDCLLS